MEKRQSREFDGDLEVRLEAPVPKEGCYDSLTNWGLKETCYDRGLSSGEGLAATNMIVPCGGSGSLITIVILKPESTTSFSISSGKPKYLVAMPLLIVHRVFGS